MRTRIFLDTNIFVYAFEFKNSNSAKIIDLLNKGEIEAIVSERVLKEVIKYFQKHHSIALARLYRRFLLESCIVIQRESVLDEIENYKNKIKEKDIEQIAVVKKLGIKYIVAYDRNFEDFKEYTTPKDFLKIMKIKNEDVEY